MKQKNNVNKVVKAVYKIKNKAYQKPILTCYGDVRDVTLGGSPGGGDSGTLTTRRRR